MTKPSARSWPRFSPGTSFSGLHAVEIAATDIRLRGAIAQNPLVDGLAAITMASPTRSLKLFAVGVLDRLGSLLGRPPRYIPAGVAPGEFGAVAEHDTIAPVGPALRVAERAPKAELFRSRGDHYDVYEGGEDYDRVINAEVEIPASASTGSRPVTPAGAAQSRTSGGARRSGP